MTIRGFADRLGLAINREDQLYQGCFCLIGLSVLRIRREESHREEAPPVTCLLFQRFSIFIAKGVTIIEVAVVLTERQR